MTTEPTVRASAAIDGPQLARLCRDAPTSPHDQSLIQRLQAAYPDLPIKLARRGHAWYRLGGVIRPDGQRIAAELNEWAERTYIECGQNFNTLLELCETQRYLATRHKGTTLYLVARTGPAAEDFVQIEVDRTQEHAYRNLVDEEHPPEDVEELIDPVAPMPFESFSVGEARYAYRRKTDVRVFMEEFDRHRADRHPARRFMHDWNRSSAGLKHVFCDFWSLHLSQHLGRHGERLMEVEIAYNRLKDLPLLEETLGKKGKALASRLTRFDVQAGFPMAWYFYLVKGLAPSVVGLDVQRDLDKDYAYLPDRDAAVLRDWFAEPYQV
jgi:hypothetical protein